MAKMVMNIDQIRVQEKKLFDIQCVPSLIVMERAALAVTATFFGAFPNGGRFLVLSGCGY